LEPITAQEWGRRQAAAAPAWTDDQWRRICAALRINLPQPEPQHEDQDDGEARDRAEDWTAQADLRRAA
jgi:hypothetical protein